MKKSNLLLKLSVYTILFCIVAAGIFVLFIVNNKTFIYDGDASDQGYFWTIEMKNSLHSLLAGDGYPLWSWYRGMGLDAKLPIDPFVVIASLFPIAHMELGYSVAILLRLFFAGIAFVLFAHEVELDGFQSAFGSICYVFSTWTINLALMQGQYIDIFILFPLLALAVDRICKGKSPAPFIFIVGITVAVNFYLAYMSAIIIILYLLLRYFHYHSEDGSFTDYLAYVGRFMLYGIAGIMISAVFVMATLQTLSGASTGAKPIIDTFYDTMYYYTTGIRFVSYGYAVSYSYIGIPAVALTVLFAGRKPTIKATHGIMAFLLFVMTLFPFFGSMFNGFSYVSNRWYFLLIFFVVWTASEHMDPDNLKRPHCLVIMILTWIVLAGSTLGLAYYDITGDLGMNKALFIAGSLAAAAFMILVILLGWLFLKPLWLRKTLIILTLAASLIVCWNCTLRTHMDYFYNDGTINGQLEASTQRAGSQIEDDGFYRIDQVDWINIEHKADQPANENLRWENNTIYLYDSKIPSRLSLFNKYLGNNMGYSKRVYVQSNGNRMGLDFLEGIKYFLGNDTKNGKMDSSDYAGYGFEKYKDIDGVEVFRNKYDSGLGFTYGSYIRESEFLKLSRLEREQAILQAIVMPDVSCDSINGGREVKAEDIETDIDNIEYTIVGGDGCTAADDNTFVADKDHSYITIHVEGVEDSQMVVSFDNLRRYNAEGTEVGDFYLSCVSAKLTAGASNSKNNQTIPDITDFDLNMGYYDNYTGNLKIHFNKAGTYTFDKLYVSAMKVANYDKYAAARAAGSYRVSDYNWKQVNGTVKAVEDGLLFISIPVNGNWKVYIDGERAREYSNANIAFLAAEITKGEHDVVLKYDMNGRVIGLAITCSGIIFGIILSLLARRRRKKRAAQAVH